MDDSANDNLDLFQQCQPPSPVDEKFIPYLRKERERALIAITKASMFETPR